MLTFWFILGIRVFKGVERKKKKKRKRGRGRVKKRGDIEQRKEVRLGFNCDKR